MNPTIKKELVKEIKVFLKKEEKTAIVKNARSHIGIYLVIQTICYAFHLVPKAGSEKENGIEGNFIVDIFGGSGGVAQKEFEISSKGEVFEAIKKTIIKEELRNIFKEGAYPRTMKLVGKLTQDIPKRSPRLSNEELIEFIMERTGIKTRDMFELKVRSAYVIDCIGRKSGKKIVSIDGKTEPIFISKEELRGELKMQA